MVSKLITQHIVLKGGKGLANAQLLDDYVIKSGKTKCHLADAMGISRPYLYALLKHPERCTFSQVEILSKEVNIKKLADKNEIFLP